MENLNTNWELDGTRRKTYVCNGAMIQSMEMMNASRGINKNDGIRAGH